MAERILIVDDEELIRSSLKQVLERRGYEVYLAGSADEAREKFSVYLPGLVLLDLRLPDGDGLELLREFKEIQPDVLIIIMTAYGTVSSAVKAIKLGAYDYISKPFKANEISLIVKLALETRSLHKDMKKIVEEQSRRYGIANIIGESPSMREIFDIIRKVAPKPDVTVLISGESGTGKELIARALHYESPRAGKSFVSINCAAIPKNLLESELFGYEKGAFTDAKSTKKGLFEEADGGTIFLDEIGDMDLLLQAKLLRAIEEKSFRRVGGVKNIPFDVRIIAATNKDLEKLIKEGLFREDLYYRLKVISIHIPPLRERKEDILPLTRYFIGVFNERFSRKVRGLTSKAEEMFLRYEWRGNVRELRNTIERIMILEDTEYIDVVHLPKEMLDPHKGKEISLTDIDIRQGINIYSLLDEIMSGAIKKALKIANGNKSLASRLLGISRANLRYHMKRLHINEP